MTKFQYINKNIEGIKKEIRFGIISCSVLRHIQIYSRYDYYRMLGHLVSVAVMFTSCDLKVSEKTVYEVIKEMEYEIE